METIRKGACGQAVRILQGRLALHVDGVFGPITEEAVKYFQSINSLVADGIVGPKTWAALGLNKHGRAISKIILHCTATPEGRDFSVEQIRQWHLARGFSDIGYHYVVGRDGTVYEGRPESIVGAHCTGQNTCSIGISYVGGEAADGSHKPKDTRTQAQKKALRELVESLKRKYPGATVHCHYEFANKACPSFKLCDL